VTTPESDTVTDTRPAPADPAPPTGVLTMTAGDLRDLLHATATCTVDDIDLPYLTAIRLHSEAGHLVGLATDQFRLARAHKPATGALTDPVWLPAAGARRLVRALDDITRRENPVQLHVTTAAAQGDLLQLLVDDTPVCGVRLPADFAEPRYLPQILNLVDPADYDGATLTGMIGFNPRIITAVEQALGTSGEPYVRCYLRGPMLPLRVEAGDWLVLMLMPSKLHPDHSGGPRIPFALPDAPAVLPTGGTEPTEFGWPQTVDEVTVGRFLRHYLAALQDQQDRIWDYPWPNLPPGPERDEVQQRAAQARADMHIALVDRFAVTHLLRAFAQVAPAAALQACRELWHDLDAGDVLGERVWEWLVDEGADPDALPKAALAARRDEQAEQIMRQVFAVPPPRLARTASDSTDVAQAGNEAAR
jgi:hypothetical protein